MERIFEFEEFAKNELGDIAVWDNVNEVYLGQKISRYYTMWVTAASTQTTQARSLLPADFFKLVYEVGEGDTFVIDRANEFIRIALHHGHTKE